jgi:hypothetical protein
LIRSDRADPGADATASPPAVNLRLKAKEMTSTLSDGISALVDGSWSGLGVFGFVGIDFSKTTLSRPKMIILSKKSPSPRSAPS